MLCGHRMVLRRKESKTATRETDLTTCDSYWEKMKLDDTREGSVSDQFHCERCLFPIHTSSWSLWLVWYTGVTDNALRN